VADVNHELGLLTEPAAAAWI
jgi:hypothetical protein